MARTKDGGQDSDHTNTTHSTSPTHLPTHHASEQPTAQARPTMPGFFNSLSSYFSSSSATGSVDRDGSSRHGRRQPDVLSSTRDAFSLPSHQSRSDSPGYGYGRGGYQDDSRMASRSESPAFGEHVGTLSRPDRANLGVSVSPGRWSSETPIDEQLWTLGSERKQFSSQFHRGRECSWVLLPPSGF